MGADEADPSESLERRREDLTGETIARFRVIERLGGGGMGTVWLAEDIGAPDRRVALKVLRPKYTSDPALRKRFLREARHAIDLEHPNIAAVHEVGDADDHLFIVLELIRGRNLRQVLQEQHRVPVAKTLEYMIPIARALAHAHSRDIVHRDLKPENVMLADDGEPRLLDFGIAKLLEGERAAAEPNSTELRTVEGVVLGTTEYMSPEQAVGGVVDKRSDVFSFGVMLYELLYGARPFRGDSAAEIVSAIIRDEPSPIADVSVAVREVLAKCLAKRASERYRDANEVLGALEALSANSAALARPKFDDGLVTVMTQPHAAASAQRPDGTRRLVIAALLVAGVLGALAIAWQLRSRRSLRPSGAIVQTLVQEFENEVFDPALSPDGKTIALGMHGAVWLLPADGGPGREIPTPGRVVDIVTVLPDGKLLTVETDDKTARGLWLMNADTSGRQQLATGVSIASVTFDGKRVAYHTKRGLEVLELATNRKTLVTPTALSDSIRAVAWSPSGDRLAWVREGVSVPGGAMLEIASPNGGTTEVVYRSGDLVGLVGPSVAFRHDELLFTRVIDNNSELWKFQLVGGRPQGEPRQIHRWDSGLVTGMTVSSNGERIAFRMLTRSYDIVTVALTPPYTMRTVVPEQSRFPEWTADGTELVYSSSSSEPPGLHRLPLAGGTAVRISESCVDCMPVRTRDQMFVVVGATQPTFDLAVLGAEGRLDKVATFDRTLFGTTPMRCSLDRCFLGESRDGYFSIRELDARHRPGPPVINVALPALKSQPYPTFSPSPDGRSFAFVIGDNSLRIATRTGEVRDLVKLEHAQLIGVEWAPDGQRLYVSGMMIGDATYAVLAVKLDGTYERIYASEHRWVGTPRVSPDSSTLALVRSTYRTKIWRFDSR